MVPNSAGELLTGASQLTVQSANISATPIFHKKSQSQLKMLKKINVTRTHAWTPKLQ